MISISSLAGSPLNFNNIETPKNLKLIGSLQFFSRVASMMVFFMSSLVILGWQFDIAPLKSVLPGLVTMKANTAIGLMLGSSAIWLLQQPKSLEQRKGRGTQQRRKRFLYNPHLLAQLLASLVTLIGLLTLMQYSFGLDLKIDQLFFPESIDAIATYSPGRMALNTAANFVLFGSAILLIAQRVYFIAQCFAIIALSVAFLGLLGYFYGLSFLYGIGSYSQMAVHTIAAFILLGLSILFVYPAQGLMTVATSQLAGGIMLRRLLLPAIGIPPILCWFILAGKRLQLYDDDVGLALLCILNILVLALLIWWNARTLGALDYQALHDLLTGLPNRILFHHRLSVSLANARCSQGRLAVMFLDLDRFKKINDSLGHAVGDRLLQAVAARLNNCLRESDTLARWGGDEFTLLLPQINEPECSAKIAQKILDALKPSFLIGSHHFHITSSIGIALYPHDGEDPETLIKNADVALYIAKEQGRNNYQFYIATIEEEASELLILESHLHRALECEEFVLYYQPKVNINTGKITGMEALVRWRSPELGLISPVKFIPIAEDNGLILPIGEWVLRAACTQNKAWMDAGLSPIRIAVNLSARQLQQSNLVEIVEKILIETGLDPWFLELEVTETIAMQHVESTRKILAELNRMGVLISIDDFGTGYSSLNYLKQLPIQTIKIDRSFVRDLTVDPYDMAIASAIVALGHGLNMSVVAEGVETQEQLKCLRELGCEEMQGYFFSKPLSLADAIALLKNYRLSIVTSS